MYIHSYVAIVLLIYGQGNQSLNACSYMYTCYYEQNKLPQVEIRITICTTYIAMYHNHEV